MKVIGITGTMASGKDAVREAIEKRTNTVSIRLSDLIDTSLLKKRRVEITRTIKQDLGDELRQKYGSHVLAKIATSFMKKADKLKIIDGIKNPGEIDFLKDQFGDDFILIAVDAAQELRFKRIVERKKSGDSKTWEDFIKTDERDQGKDQPSYGQQVKKCMEMADIQLENDGDIQKLKAEAEKIVDEIL